MTNKTREVGAPVDLTTVSNIMRTDSYKVTHWLQYPPGTEYIYSYLESRGGEYSKVTFFGLQYYLKAYLSKPITMADIDYAEKRFVKHFGNAKLFNRKGWEKIVNDHKGLIPVKIKAAPEGLTFGTRNVMVTIENEDPALPWVTNYVETLLMKVWYTCTVATISRNIKELIYGFLEKTGDVAEIDYKLHDFGYRGVSSEESAAIGGMSHLVNFKGTDTMIALEAASMFYDSDMAGNSIPAAEHSTIMAWGQEFEYEAYQNMIKQFGDGYIYAVVSDTYNIYSATETIWGTMLKKEVQDAPGILVVRPDSGTPHEVVRQIVEILGEKFGYTVNPKGYKVINKVRVIQGDGINYEEIKRILEALEMRGWSASNVAFGMGGALLQKMDRDTQRFAIKASQVVVNGRVRDIHKSPVTDNNKRSKAGRLKLILNNNVYETIDAHEPGTDILRVVWEHGGLVVDDTFDVIRERAAIKGGN